MEETQLFICEDCGQTTPVKPVEGEPCPNCGGKLLAFDSHQDEPADHELEDDSLGSGLADPEVGTQSLEALADKELEEDDQDYRAKTSGSEDE